MSAVDASVCFQQRVLFSQKGENEKALLDYNMAIQLNPNYADAYMNKGVLYNKNVEIEKALQDYQIVLLLTPDHPVYLTNLGSLYFKQKQFGQANIYFAKAKQSLDSNNQQQISKWNLSNSNLAYKKFKIRYKQQIFELIIYLNNYKDRSLFNQRNKPRNQQMNQHNKQSHQIFNQIQIYKQLAFRFWNNLSKSLMIFNPKQLPLQQMLIHFQNKIIIRFLNLQNNQIKKKIRIN